MISNIKCQKPPNTKVFCLIRSLSQIQADSYYFLLLTFPLTFLSCSFWAKETNYWALSVFSTSYVLSGYQLDSHNWDLAVGWEFYGTHMDLSMTYWVGNGSLGEKTTSKTSGKKTYRSIHMKEWKSWKGGFSNIFAVILSLIL